MVYNQRCLACYEIYNNIQKYNRLAGYRGTTGHSEIPETSKRRVVMISDFKTDVGKCILEP